MIGRDTYIAFNNGGVYKEQYFVTGGFERGGLPWKRTYTGCSIPVKAKMTHYVMNGSGRDKYIGYDFSIENSYDHGGFTMGETNHIS
jgi:hypothetical protein